MIEYFKEKEIPYNELQKLGINKEQFLDLPKQVLTQLMAGKWSPMIVFEMKHNDQLLRIPGKFAFRREEDGNISVYTKHKGQELDNDLKLTDEDFDKLKKDRIIVTDIEHDGIKEKMYVQLDPETNAITAKPQSEILIPNAIGDIILGEKDKENIRDGRPVELEKGETRITVGVDLNSRNGFKVIDGDMNEWKQKKLIDWDKSHPGVKGYWKTTENGLMYEAYRNKRQGLEPDGEDNSEKQSRGYTIRR